MFRCLVQVLVHQSLHHHWKHAHCPDPTSGRSLLPDRSRRSLVCEALLLRRIRQHCVCDSRCEGLDEVRGPVDRQKQLFGGEAMQYVAVWVVDPAVQAAEIALASKSRAKKTEDATAFGVRRILEYGGAFGCCQKTKRVVRTRTIVGDRTQRPAPGAAGLMVSLQRWSRLDR